MSIIWTRIRITDDDTHPCELSCRVCGREISKAGIDRATAAQIAANGMPAGLSAGSDASAVLSYNDVVVVRKDLSGSGCSCFGGIESRYGHVRGNAVEAVVDKFGSLILVSTLLIRRFNPAASLEEPTGLVDNVKELVEAVEKKEVGYVLEHVVHLVVGLADVSLGIAGLIMIPGSPQRLYATLKNPSAPMTFDNYSTLFVMYWLLGALLLLCMIPLRSKRRSIQMFGWPGAIAYGVSGLANVVLFCLGCWKINYASRHRTPWTPMLSYWIGGASAISFPMCGIEVFHTFGVIGLVFMLIHTFNTVPGF
jgi:hypothetical protein